MVESSGELIENAGRGVVDTIRENPIPIAMVGVGVGWLLYGVISGSSRPAGRGRSRKAAADAEAGTSASVTKIGDRIQKGVKSNPLVAGTIAVAAGAALGFALPQTETENELLGEARDAFLTQAQALTKDVVAGQVEFVTDRAAEAAKDAIIGAFTDRGGKVH